MNEHCITLHSVGNSAAVIGAITAKFGFYLDFSCSVC